MDGTSKLKYCPWCMELDNMDGLESCPRCGRGLKGLENGKEELQIYSVIDGRYMAGKSRETGEESILYIGLDLTEKKRVWIREFFCRSLAYRNPKSPGIHTYAGQKEAYLKKYDACVQKFQKAGGDKKISFANGTVYQISPLSEEEVLTLCQASDAADGSGEDSGKKEEARALPKKEERNAPPGKQERKKAFPGIATSKKAKVAIAAMLAICLAVGLFQKHGLENRIGDAGKAARSASASLRPKKTESPHPAPSASANSASMAEPAGVPIPAATQIPTSQPVAGSKPMEEENASGGGKNPAEAKATGNSAEAKKESRASGKPAEAKEETKAADKPAEARRETKPSKKPVSAGKPGNAVKKPSSNVKPDKKKSASRKTRKQNPGKQKQKKRRNVIDDSALDKKVYEID